MTPARLRHLRPRPDGEMIPLRLRAARWPVTGDVETVREKS